MTERWAEATWTPATSNAGPYTGGAAKGVLHTTEGGSFAGALSVYQREGYWPHATLSYETGHFQAWQHLDLGVAAKALEHPPGTGATNTDHAIQVEIVGSADRDYAHTHRLLYVEDFPVDYLAGIARWMRYVERVAGVLPVLVAPFGPPGTVRRLSWPEWHGASGWLGHCHVPANRHTDPGNIPIVTLIPHADPKPPRPATPLPHFPEETDMPAPTDVVDSAVCPDGGGWDMQADGGVFAWPGTPRGVPRDYIAVANDKSRYHFDPATQAAGKLSYPALNAQGARYFVRMLILVA